MSEEIQPSMQPLNPTPEEDVSNYNGAIMAKNNAVELDRAKGLKGDLRRFFSGIFGSRRNPQNYMDAMSRAGNAIDSSKAYAENNLPTLKIQAQSDALADGKEVKDIQ